jgi:hypothetical protein
MRTNNGAVDHRVLVVRLTRQVLEDPGPHAGFAPATEPGVDLVPVAKAFRQIAPGYTGAVAVENGFDEQAIVLGGDADMALTAG